MAPRRSPRLHPQIQATEEGAGVASHRSPRLQPQIETSDEGAGTSSAESASLPDDDDMLREILLRLPPQPSSLPRASAVCRRWRGLVADPKFHRQFYAHHRKPPLLGVFLHSNRGIEFTPMHDPPDGIPPRRISLGRYSGQWSADYDLLDCRHGLVLVKYGVRNNFVVCDPITREQRRVSVPPEFKYSYIDGAVLCAAGDLGHVHGACHSRPFKVVLRSICKEDSRQIACVYSSETGAWGNFISIEASCTPIGRPAVLVGSCLYWLCDDILQFDVNENSLTVIRGPVSNSINYGNRQIIQTEDGAVGFVTLCHPHFHIWHMNVNDYGVATWMPWKTIEMRTILGLSPPIGGQVVWAGSILGYDEDIDAIFLYLNGNVYMVQLKSMQSTKLNKTFRMYCYHPFKSFYTPAIRKGDEADMLHST